VAHGFATSRADGGTGLAPVFTSSPTTSAFCGAPYHYSGTHTPDVTGTGPFAFTVAPIPGSALPAGLTVDPATGDFGWTPSKADVGTHPVIVSVSNADGTATQTFSIVVECKDDQKVAVGCTSAPGEAMWLVLLLTFARKYRSRRSIAAS
jgi:hypothetical protein